MYLKLAFDCNTWVMPTVWCGLVGRLASPPKIIDTLPQYLQDRVKANEYISADSLFSRKDGKRYEFYIDCKDMGGSAVKKAIESFARHYDDYARGMPTAVIGDKPEGNEIIRNMQIALDNTKCAPAQQQSFIGEYQSECQLQNLLFV